MKPSTLVATLLILAGLVAAWRPASPSPAPQPTPPDAATRAAVAGVTAKLTGHPDEARTLAAFYAAAADAVRRDGQGVKVLRTTPQLRVFLERAATLRLQGAFAKVPGLAEAIHGPDGALAKLLGLDAAEVNHARAAAALEAIAWACAEATR